MRQWICRPLGVLRVLVLGAPLAFGVPLGLVSHGAVGAALSSKRGIASSQYLASNPGKLSKLGASWAYDWSATAPLATGGLMWVPMIAKEPSLTPSTINQLRAAGRAGRVRYLLGFNEPDSASQSNLTPQQAAALWPQLERTGLILGSPAPATPFDGWLASFMTLARQRHLRVDFIALHYYQDFTNPNAVAELHQQLVSLYHQYRRPIWITEIGAIDIRAWHESMTRTPTDPLAARYMRKLFGMLDALPFVQRYAWFTDDCWTDIACRFGSLYSANGRTTLAGRTFMTAR
ncbi:MAG TPA: glycosyl hydrolase [Solirubrobacteraceae bacterium]|nr:glycosyl hydrolase [Solirubrobacteraceae bacterium]